MERYFEINENGYNIRCKLYCTDQRNITRIVVFLHGFGGHKDNAAAAKFAERMLSKYKGTALVTFNWPCHGDDVRKKLTLADCNAYLDLVIRYLREKYDPQLYAYAVSFGGYLTLKYIMENGNPFYRIVLRSPALNLYEAMTGVIIKPEERERLEKGKDVAVGFDRKVMVSPAFLAEIRENDIRKLEYLDYAEDILIIHGSADEIIPLEVAYDFVQEQLMEFLVVEGADHRFQNPVKMEQAIKAILAFFLTA